MLMVLAEVKVIGVAKNDLRPERFQFIRINGFDGGFRSDRHEHRRS
jgi:hypothetical protein